MLTIKTIFLIANSDGAIFNFRQTLIRKIVTSGHKVVTISGSSVEGSYRKKLEDLGVHKHVELNFSGAQISPLPFISLIYSISKLCRGFNPDVVHCFTHKGCIAGALAIFLSRSKKARVIFTITGLGRIFTSNGLVNIVLRQLITKLYLFLCLRAYRVFFQNPDDAELFQRRCRLDEKKIIIVGGSGIDLEKINTSSTYKLDIKSAPINKSIELKEQQTMVLMLGRGMIEKGFFEYYQAAKFISELFPDKYLFVHAGYIDEEVLSRIDDRSIESFASSHVVKFLGFRQDSAALLSYSDIVIHPSYYREGVPRSLIEALAMDKAIITCDTIGNRETLIDGWNGFFCKPKDCQSLIAMILKADGDFRSKSRGRSLALAQRKFDVKIIDNAVEKSYFN